MSTAFAPARPAVGDAAGVRALVAGHAQFVHGMRASLLIAVAAVLATAAASLLLRLAKQPRRLPHLVRVPQCP